MPFPLVPPSVGVCVRFSSPFYRLRVPCPSGEHSGQREGKDVPVLLRCAGRGILGSRRAKCGLLREAGRDGPGTSLWRLHRWRVLPACQGDVHSETGTRDHLCRLADNQPCSILVVSSAWGCTDMATNYPVPQGCRSSLTQRPPLYAGLQPLLTC